MTQTTKSKPRCKICGKEYDTLDEAMACIEECKQKQKLAMLSALITNMDWEQSQIEVMWKTVAVDTTPEEFAYFLNVANAAGLNPFLREIYCWKSPKTGKLTIMTGRDGYLKAAKRDSTFRGIQSMEVCEKDTFSIDNEITSEGIEQTVTHKIDSFVDRGKIIGAWARAEFDGQTPIIVYASAAEYKQSNKDVWNKNESAMMRKVPESMALKRGAGISGLVTHEEIEVPAMVSAAVESNEVKDAEYVDVSSGVKKMTPKFPGAPDDVKEVIPPAPPDVPDTPAVAPPDKKKAKRTNTPAKKDNATQEQTDTSASKPMDSSAALPGAVETRGLGEIKKPVSKSVVIHDLPKGKKLIPVNFPDVLSEYPINTEYPITAKKFDDAGTHWDVGGSGVWVKGDIDGTLVFSDAKGFVPPAKCVHVAVVHAILRFGIDKVKQAYPNVSIFGDE